MKRSLIYLAFFLFYGHFAFPQNTFQELINAGNQNIRIRDFKAAISNFNQALNVQPNDTSALSGIIKACLLSSNLNDAEKYITDAISAHPQNPEFVLRKGILNNMNSLFEAAIDDFNLALSYNPTGSTLIQVYLNRATSEVKLENYEKAIADYNLALELSPRNPNIYNFRGFANYKMGNFNEAISDYTKTLDLDLNNASAFYNRGMAYLKINDRSKACIDFHKSCNMKFINACKMIMSECSFK